jgi:hypothetical protein
MIRIDLPNIVKRLRSVFYGLTVDFRDVFLLDRLLLETDKVARLYR